MKATIPSIRRRNHAAEIGGARIRELINPTFAECILHQDSISASTSNGAKRSLKISTDADNLS